MVCLCSERKLKKEQEKEVNRPVGTGETAPSSSSNRVVGSEAETVLTTQVMTPMAPPLYHQAERCLFIWIKCSCMGHKGSQRSRLHTGSVSVCRDRRF